MNVALKTNKSREFQFHFKNYYYILMNGALDDLKFQYNFDTVILIIQVASWHFSSFTIYRGKLKGILR